MDLSWGKTVLFQDFHIWKNWKTLKIAKISSGIYSSYNSDENSLYNFFCEAYQFLSRVLKRWKSWKSTVFPLKGPEVDFLIHNYFCTVIDASLNLHTKFQVFLTKFKIFQKLRGGPLIPKDVPYKKIVKIFFHPNCMRKYPKELFPIFRTIVVNPSCAPQSRASAITKINFSRSPLL